MDAVEITQLRQDMEVLKKAFLESLGRETQQNEYIEKAFRNIGILADSLNEERHLNIVLSKFVAHILARECFQNKNPVDKLNSLLSIYYNSAECEEIKIGNEEISAMLRQAGVATTPPTQEEIEEERDAGQRAMSYRTMADRIRSFAVESLLEKRG
jgi:hypothetical protein